MIENLKNKQIEEEDAKAKQKEITRKLKESLRNANEIYMKNIETIKTVFKNDKKTLDFLNPFEKKETRFDKKTEQILAFYNRLSNEDILEKLKRYGKTLETINKDKESIEKTIELDSIQEELKSKTIQIAHEKQIQEKNYTREINKLIKLIKIEFKKRPEILEIID
jgi:hypothetical protein